MKYKKNISKKIYLKFITKSNVFFLTFFQFDFLKGGNMQIYMIISRKNQILIREKKVEFFYRFFALKLTKKIIANF